LPAFGGRNLVSILSDGQGQAGIYTNAIDKHRAGPALAVIAAFFCASEVQPFAQQIDECDTGLRFELIFLTIDSERICISRWPGCRSLNDANR
jgi:hypothetical protein